LAVQGLEVLQRHVTDELEKLKSLAQSNEPAQITAPVVPERKRALFTPSVRRAMSERVKALWRDPVYKAQVLAARRRTMAAKRRAK
jgi:hypothetical protein